MTTGRREASQTPICPYYHLTRMAGQSCRFYPGQPKIMKKPAFDHKIHLHAFMKTAQYLAGLTTHEDIWHHVGEVMVKFYGADSAGFARRGSDGGVEFHHVTASDGVSRDRLFSKEVQEVVAEVLETGFLGWRAIPAGEQPYVIVFLPIALGNEPAAVMLVGHAAAGPISNEVLNVYLSVAGLAGTTITKLTSEIELRRHRSHLEELVAERTSALTRTLDRLEEEIAERSEAEEKLRKYREHLEELVEERTAELAIANEELVDYSEKLERTNQELQEFAFAASHDLQEPLRKIQTFGDLLKTRFTDLLGEEGKDFLDRMIRSSSRMSTLLRSLLAYSRIASVGNPLEPTDLAHAAREAASDLEVDIDRAGACVEVGELPVIDADAVQMRELFQNLISNSLKYCRESEKPVIKVHALSSDDTCQIYVEDNGIGFEETYLDRIFRPFQRLHTRSAIEGSGMGLSICRKIVERHEGNITAKSTPGRGSIFVVTLPVRQTKSQAGSIPSPPRSDQ